MENTAGKGFNPNEVTGIARPTMVLFFVVDTSGSMTGSKITSVNVAIEDVLPEISDLSNSNADAKIKVAMLEFSNGARWVTSPDHPEDLYDFNFKHFTASGMTDLGKALDELNSKLSRHVFLRAEGQERRGYMAPGIFFFTDGAPTDDWEPALDRLRQNKWYQNAIRVAVAIGDDADMNVLETITGSKELVTKVKDPKQLRAMIKFIAVTSSQIGSKSGTTESIMGESTGADDDLSNLNANQIQMGNELQTFADDLGGFDKGW